MNDVTKVNQKEKWLKMTAIVAFVSLVFLFLLAPVGLAADAVTGDAAGNWALGWLKWGVVLVVAFNSIKQLMKGAYAVGLIIIVAGAILYFFLNDPAGFFNSFDFIPKFLTGK